MTTDRTGAERVAEIQAQLKAAYDSTQDPRSDLTTITITQAMDEMFVHASRDLQWCLADNGRLREQVASDQAAVGWAHVKIGELNTEIARLRAILAALPEPVVFDRDDWRVCPWCHANAAFHIDAGRLVYAKLLHAPDCPWLAVQTALQEAP